MTLSTRRARIAGTAAVVALLLAALGIRMASDRHQSGPRPASPAPDDSQIPIPTSPPPLPADSMQQMRDINLQLNVRSPSVSLPVQVQSAEMARGIGDLWRAEALLRSALRAAPSDRHIRFLLGDILSQQERLEPARQVYLLLNREDPGDPEPYLQMQSILLREGKRAEAWKWLSRGTSESAQTPANMIAFAHRYYSLNDVPAARRTLSRALQIAPNDINAQLQTAILLFQRVQLAESRTILEATLLEHPDNEPALRLLAGILIHPAYAQQDAARANTLLERAVALDPKDANIYRLAASTYRRLRLFRMAAEAYTAFLTLEPRNAAGRYGLGQTYEILGRNDLARAQFSLSRMLRASEERIAPLSSAVSQHPGSAASHYALGRGLESNGDYAGALRELQVAAGLAPADREVKAQLTELYGRLGWGTPAGSVH